MSQTLCLTPVSPLCEAISTAQLGSHSESLLSYALLDAAAKTAAVPVSETMESWSSVVGVQRCDSVSVANYSFSFYCCTEAGMELAAAKENQDTCLAVMDVTAEAPLVFGVFDGHGHEGKAVSQFVARRLPGVLSQCPLLQQQAYEASLLAAFPEVNRQVRLVSSIDTSLSGSTGCLCILADRKIIIANLGDSRAVLGTSLNSRVVAVPLTTDHSPRIDEEARRVVESGGRIASYTWGGQVIGPPRVWLKEVNMPGLCMTRSFGDNVAATVGIIDLPEVVVHKLCPDDKYLLLMSDGVYEFMDSQEVMTMVHQLVSMGMTVEDAAQEVVREARRRWLMVEGHNIDDCSIVVVEISCTNEIEKSTCSLLDGLSLGSD